MIDRASGQGGRRCGALGQRFGLRRRGELERERKARGMAGIPSGLTSALRRTFCFFVCFENF